MGVIRLLLALAVVSAHVGRLFNLPFIGGDTSVECFFMISGFYMALVLSTKYTGHDSYVRFMKARILRLFPAYGAIAAISLVFALITWRYGLDSSAAGGGMFAYFAGPSTGLAILIAANLLIVGQDALMFTAVDRTSGRLYFAKNFAQEPLPAYSGLLIPQAWSLSLELMFYAIAPVLAPLPVWALGALAAVSLALRMTIQHVYHLNYDPWTYRFFPSELVFFFAGMTAYRAYSWLAARENSARTPSIGRILWSLLVLAILTQRAWPIPHQSGVFFALFAVALPFVFLIFRHNRIDRIIGALSYPLYLVHLLVWSVLGSMHIGEAHVVAGLSLLAAALILYCIELPVERWRARTTDRGAGGNRVKAN